MLFCAFFLFRHRGVANRQGKEWLVKVNQWQMAMKVYDTNDTKDTKDTKDTQPFRWDLVLVCGLTNRERYFSTDLVFGLYDKVRSG